MTSGEGTLKGSRISRTWLFVIAAAVVGGAAGALVTLPGKSAGPEFSLDQVIQPIWPSLILYCLFSLYWAAAAKNSARAESKEPLASTALHQGLLVIALLMMFLRVPGLTGRWLPGSWVIAASGIAIQAASTLLAIWARRHLGRNWSAEISAKVDHQLIRSGPYARLRHPIYTAMFGIYLGMAIASGEWHALIGFGVLCVAYARKITLEERNMVRVFGAQYDAYRRESWALVPWVL